MSRPIRPLSERLAEQRRRKALGTIARTDHLLALILLQLRSLQGRIDVAERASILEQAGFSKKQAAAVLGTTPEVLSMSTLRKKRSELTHAVDAVDPNATRV